MTTPQLPDAQAQHNRSEAAPSPRQAWSMVFVLILGFVIGGLGLVFGHDGYFYLLYVGTGVFFLGCLYGWSISIFEYTEEETKMYASGMVERVEPETKPGHG